MNELSGFCPPPEPQFRDRLEQRTVDRESRHRNNRARANPEQGASLDQSPVLNDGWDLGEERIAEGRIDVERITDSERGASCPFSMGAADSADGEAHEDADAEPVPKEGKEGDLGERGPDAPVQAGEGAREALIDTVRTVDSLPSTTRSVLGQDPVEQTGEERERIPYVNQFRIIARTVAEERRHHIAAARVCGSIPERAVDGLEVRTSR
ncbi:hypothetical protein ACIOKD_20335 [Streptomyces sp. NPDC087844]|uniref:hypothetical protein n=1 Tax=Streptomyces sp. NPDC087844 TaxID=3365805 RepID=UPI0037FF8408